MLRIAIILSLVLQPLTLLRANCPSAFQAQQTAATGACHAPSAPSCCGSEKAPAAVAACCTGASMCACGERDNAPSAPAPSRTSGIDQFLVLLHLPSGLTGDMNRRLPGRSSIASDDLVLASVSAPQAFYCVWLT